MTSAYDLYKFYLEPADLRGQSHSVTIASVKPEQIFDTITKRDITKLLITLEEKKKKLPLNKTQVGALIKITGTDDYTKWTGTKITITPATAPNRKETITITPHPAKEEQVTK